MAANLNDTKRMLQLAERVQFLLDKNTPEEPNVRHTTGTWFTTNSSGGSYHKLGVSAPDTAHLLTEFDTDLLAPPLMALIAKTNEHLSQM